MPTNPALETFIVGMLCGVVLGAAAALSRRFLGPIFGIGAAAIAASFARDADDGGDILVVLGTIGLSRQLVVL